MGNRFDFEKTLNFDRVDLTAPDKVIAEIAAEFEQATRGLVCAKVEPYNGRLATVSKGWSTAITSAFVSSVGGDDVQKELGKQGDISHKFEFYLYTPNYTSYKFRLFFFEYGIANYPVKIVLEQGIAEFVLSSLEANYVLQKANREALENLVVRVLTSKYVLGIAQELLHVNQVQRDQEEELNKICNFDGEA